MKISHLLTDAAMGKLQVPPPILALHVTKIQGELSHRKSCTKNNYLHVCNVQNLLIFDYAASKIVF